MAGQEQLTNIDPEAAAELRRNGFDPHKLDRVAECALAHIYCNLPYFPVYDGLRLPPALAASDGVDRISHLPCDLRREIVSRLPVKDTARTAVLSSCWRTTWLGTPLILIDAHLLPKGQGFRPNPANSPAITAAVSSVLEAHPGPFACVHLVCSHMNSYRPQLARWLHLLAAKGVQDLVLVNRPWPCNVPLPDTIFTINTLVRLYIGLWKLPDTAALRGASFPHLRELGVCCVEMEHGAVDSLVARSPVLETLNILGCSTGLCLRLVSQSLRCMQISGSIMENIAVVDAPSLERLILSETCIGAGGLCTRVKIVDAPKLNAFGFLDPRYHDLEIQDSMITAGIKVSRMTMVTSVKFLNLNVRFDVQDDVRIVPTFLKCFPNVERLHITSERCDQSSTGNLGLKSWEEFGPIECVLSRINMMTFREFRGRQSEVGFLKFFFQSARVLKTAVIVMANPSSAPFSVDEASSKAKECSKKMASKSLQVFVRESDDPEGGEAWRFETGADFSCHDPFSAAKVLSEA